MNQHVHYPTSWTSQGDQIIYMRTNPETSADIWAVAAGGGEPRLLVSSDRGDFSGAVSPDGRWLAYVSNITDRNEIYLRPLDGSSPAQRVSIDGGRWPTWEGNQRLWFRAPEEQLMAVDLDLSAGRLVIGHPEIAFTLEEGQMESYGLHPDGRILVAFRQGRLDVEEYKVLVGW
jgi:dipeptidyl aminopeptidase/acylaminoacyl peptidase